MKRRRKIYMIIGIVLFVFAWRAWPLVGIFTQSNLEASADFSLLQSVAPPPYLGTEVTYGGLSHPGFDPERLCFDVLLNPRRILHGHAFSHAATENSKVRNIASVLSDHSSFQRWLGEKGCGGFHADRYFRWADGSQVWEVLLCMGCHEALLFHGGQTLRYDISREAAKAIETLEKGKDQ